MKLSIKNILLAGVMGLLAVSMSSCSDWTETESVDFHYVTLEEKNPALYEAYFQSIREYRESDHKVMIAKFDNKQTVPAGRADHITCLPDSVDYIILTNPSELSEAIYGEMDEVRSLKGQKVLYEVSYSSFESAYKAYLEEWKNAHPADGGEAEGGEGEEGGEGTEEPAEQPMTLAEYISENIPARLSIFKEYGYDGLNIVYSPKNPASVPESEMEAYTALQEAFLAPVAELMEKNPDALFFYEGAPQYVQVHTGIIEKMKYILLPTTTAKNEYDISHQMTLVSRFGNVPVDRFVACVTTPSLDDPTLADGKFSGQDDAGNDRTAVIGAADWVMQPVSGYVKAGVCVSRAQNDYYNLSKLYYSIREAISIMNPSPVK